jgi:hypothetical protein
MTFRTFTGVALTIASVACFVGCQPKAPVGKTITVSKRDHGHDHKDGAHDHSAHEVGPHDGTMTVWGGGKYHAEFTVDHDTREATVYLIGSDEKSPAPIKADKVLLNIKQPTFQVELSAKPLDGESNGRSSRFVGFHENLGVVQEFAGRISGEVDGKPYSGDFAEEAHVGHNHN